MVQAILEMADASGRDRDDFPRHLAAIESDLAARRTLPSTPPLPERDRSYSWTLRELDPPIPGSELRNELKDDVFVIPSLGLVAIMTRNADPEISAIMPWPRREWSPVAPLVFDTFSPTFEPILQWASSPVIGLTV